MGMDLALPWSSLALETNSKLQLKLSSITFSTNCFRESQLLAWATRAEEKNFQCQQLIRDNAHWCNDATGFYHHAVPCIHSNQLGVCVEGTFNWKPGLTFLQRARRVDKARFRYTLKCESHGGMCSLWQDRIDICSSGLPCPDQSRAGSQLFEEGESSDVFLAHAKYNVERKTKIIIIENVSDSGQGHALSIISVYLSWEGWERLVGLRGWKGQNVRHQLITHAQILLVLDLKSMILKDIRTA